MSRELLLKHFDRISDSPDAIPRLRSLILDLAVRGKLVEQYPSDEPASVVIRRFEIQKLRLLNAGEIRKHRLFDRSNVEEIPTATPAGWEWMYLGSASTMITKGSTPTSYGHAYTSEGINFIKVESITDNRLIPENVTSFISEDTHRFLARSQLASGDLLFSIAGSIGTCAIVSADILPANTNQALAIIRGTAFIFDAAFLLLCMRSSVSELVRRKARGGAMNNISLEDIQRFAVPVPPTAEQRRIVAKVDELMSLCDQLETAVVERDSRRDRLAAATLHNLNDNTVANKFRLHSQFFITHLPRLSNRPGQITHIRQAILNLAIRGKLVKQDSRDGQAATVLGDHLLKLAPDQTPWALPSGWAWTSLRLAGRVLGGGTPSKSNPEFWSGPIPWVSPKDMKVDLISDAEDHISELAVAGSAVKIIPAGALLLVVRGMILAHSFPTAITTVPVTINQDMKAIVPFRPDAARMLMLALKGLKPEILGLVLRSTHGTCRLETDALLSLPIPFPPIEEQKRILARVDELMTLCDQLEAQLTATQTAGRHLLAAALYEALNPTAAAEAA